MRAYGEPAELYWRQRKVRLRPLILILDISGSMADYSRSLLQFAHTAKHAAAKVEVFCFGTRLTRITGALAHRSPDQALAEAARPGVRLGGRDQDRRVPGHLRPGLRPPGPGPRRDRGHLLRRPRPGRPRRPGRGDGTAFPAVPPPGMDEPAQGRQRGLPAEHARDDGRAPSTPTWCCPATTCAAWKSSRRCCLSWASGRERTAGCALGAARRRFRALSARGRRCRREPEEGIR